MCLFWGGEGGAWKFYAAFVLLAGRIVIGLYGKVVPKTVGMCKPLVVYYCFLFSRECKIKGFGLNDLRCIFCIA